MNRFESVIENPEQLTANEIGSLLLGATDLVNDASYPSDQWAWRHGNREARVITPFYADADLSQRPHRVILGVPKFYLDLPASEIKAIEDLEEMPSPHPDYYHYRDENSSESYHADWMRAVVGIIATYSGFNPITYELHASPKNNGYVRTSDGVLSAHARTYDQRSSYTPVGYAKPFADILSPIIAYGETLREADLE